ncbi:unnamed protein product [Ilex paraguariensis]|uniref:Uncharacterized protein n=1 Tax=Ilex paraguariensis TaxID=185542 RepID=A0ABC8SB43_9AQUA
MTCSYVVIVYRSLRVLHMVLNYLFSIPWKTNKRYCPVLRENVMVEGLLCKNNAAEMYGSQCSEIGSLFYESWNGTSDSGPISFGTRLFNLKFPCKNEVSNHESTLLMSCVDWIALFQLMCQIVTRNKEEYVRLEAVSIMNMILMRTNAYLDREKFGMLLVFQSVSQLLRKEAGLCVQKQAVHLLYLLLNCPGLMAIFCSTYKEEGESAGDANNDAAHASSFQGFSVILDGLADCVACSGNGAQELKLRRNAIIVLAFLASSGKAGFEIVLGHRLPKRSDFLTLILHILASEMDIEASECTQLPEIFKERTLLIREALILLNRLASNPQYSTPVFRKLTNSRDVASLTLDVANRLSRKGKWLWQSDKLTRQIRESEIVDLARSFPGFELLFLAHFGFL